MAYDSVLEKKLARKTTRAIVDFDLIEDGDRVMVGLSGGKDSWALLRLLDALRRRAPIHFTLVATSTIRSRGPAMSTAGSTELSTRRLATSSTTSSTRGRRPARCAPGCGAGCCIVWRAMSGPPRSRSGITRTTSLKRSYSTCFSPAR
jgi:hypothetical protein